MNFVRHQILDKFLSTVVKWTFDNKSKALSRTLNFLNLEGVL